LLAFARETATANPSACVLSMGETGRTTRVLGPLLGCPLTFGYLTGGAVAPGQLSVLQMRKFYADFAAETPGDLSDSEWMEWAAARLPGEAHAK
jgi:3-dehydroquinate dehydratase